MTVWSYQGAVIVVQEFDVVVVGGGGSGLAAAIEAASLGRTVALLEKGDKLGGTTARSVGSISSSNTEHQRRQGILDSTDDHFDDLRKFNSVVDAPENAVLQRILVDNVPETFRWLREMGVEFFGPVKELPHRRPRMHNVLPNSRAYIYHLERRARKLGVSIHTSTQVAGLVKENGRVSGVVCKTPRGEARFSARGGVVLCSGDYAGSAEARARYLSPGMAIVEPVNPLNTGDGHDMALDLGARILNPQLHLAGLRFQAPPPKLVTSLPPYRWLTMLMRLALERFSGSFCRPLIMSFLVTVLVPSPKMFEKGAILVNRDGERFCDEQDRPGPAVAAQPGQIAYILLDGELADTFTGWPNYVSTAPGFAYASIADYRKNRKDIFSEGPTIDELARKIGVNAQTLRSTIDQYNSSTRSNALSRGPYIALGPVRYLINFTDGGLAINDRFEVIDDDGKPIPGLYAGGASGLGGALIEGHGHHLGWAFTSGRLAGRRVAQAAVTAEIAEAAGAMPAAH
ncbi:FAD-dependent oxidoreductase [Ancylobacter polymorphus]|uniref:FAD-dependent oxidoreductase n=1 Tax=Ancylobacter polymorphus TaxID=223390 RepID=A0A9E7D7C1_9HYPH|nr:FAD-dependent oxidoreductase [Ancylobacter polymorphus]UOK73310.1 FAD-dependent oxidoreductase [Ancylobacter polymorphus]